MLLVASVAVWAVTVPLLGGRLGALGELRFRRSSALVAALAIQIVIVSVLPQGSPLLHDAAHVVSYVLAAWFLAVNRRVPGLWLVALGGVLNLAAISANGGVMPASVSALVAAGHAEQARQFANSAVVAHAKLAFLGDVFALPRWVPLHNVFSIGDVGISLGAALGLHQICGSRLAAPLDGVDVGGLLARLRPAASAVSDDAESVAHRVAVAVGDETEPWRASDPEPVVADPSPPAAPAVSTAVTGFEPFDQERPHPAPAVAGAGPVVEPAPVVEAGPVVEPELVPVAPPEPIVAMAPAPVARPEPVLAAVAAPTPVAAFVSPTPPARPADGDDFWYSIAYGDDDPLAMPEPERLPA